MSLSLKGTLIVTGVDIGCLAAIYLALASGKINMARSGIDWVYRDKNPFQFWSFIVLTTIVVLITTFIGVVTALDPSHEY